MLMYNSFRLGLLILIGGSLEFIFFGIFYYYPQICMKFEINCEQPDNKTKAFIYKEIAINNDQALQQRSFQVLEKPNTRIFCCNCELDVTRHAFAILRTEYFCIKCFSNIEDHNEEYIIRSSLRKSFTDSSWDLMDEVILTTAFKLWGFGNWSQIKQYMDYNGSPFSLSQIQKHFEQFYLDKDNQLPDFHRLYDFKPKRSYSEIALMLYQRLPKQPTKRETKGQKRALNLVKNSSNFSSCRQLPEAVEDRENDDLLKEHKKQIQSERSLGGDHQLKGNGGSILGYNCKRREFELGQYDYTAETVISDLQFYDDDTPEEHLLKIELIKEYNKRLEERLKRRQFVVQYKLLDSAYTYGHQNKMEKQINNNFQPFMRYTNSYLEYKNLIGNVGLTKKYERFISNLSQIRGKISQNGKIDESFDYLKKKRKKYIKNWEKMYNKGYADKKRKIFHIGRSDKANQLRIIEKQGEQSMNELPFDLADLSFLKFQRESESIKKESTKFTALLLENSQINDKRSLI